MRDTNLVNLTENLAFSNRERAIWSYSARARGSPIWEQIAMPPHQAFTTPPRACEKNSVNMDLM